MSKRLTRFVAIDADGVPLPHCTGNCHGGRGPCNCPTGMTEMACDLAHDAMRVIQPPQPAPEPNWRARSAAMALAVAAALYLVVVALLAWAGARSLRGGGA